MDATSGLWIELLSLHRTFLSGPDAGLGEPSLAKDGDGHSRRQALTSNRDLGLHKVSRAVIVRGQMAIVECAVTESGVSPALDAIEQLRNRSWPDPDGRTLPDEAQALDYAMLMELIQDVADGGYGPVGYTNYLRDGVWEFKVRGIRMTFYDTDGRGSSVDKSFKRDDVDWRRKLLPDDFGEIIRLGHTFGKAAGIRVTPRADLVRAFIVRKEDLDHDRRARGQNGR